MFSLLALTLIGWILGFAVTWTMALVPFAMALLFVFTLGLGIIVSVLTVYFRDVEYLLNLFLQLFYFMTPILYPLSAMPEHYRIWANMNPLYAHLNLFQTLIYSGKVPSIQEWGVAGLGALISLGLGFVVLNTLEDDLVYMM